MNPRYTLAVSLLLSTLPQLSFARGDMMMNDLEACQYECRASLRSLDVNLTDLEVLVAYSLRNEVPKCSFDAPARIKKEAIKYFVNRYVTGDSLDLNADLPNTGQVSVLNTDQALEVAYVVANDLLDKKATSELLTDAGKTFLREKVVQAILWVVSQSNIEALLPDTLTQTGLYNVVRNEVARYGVDNLFQRALGK